MNSGTYGLIAVGGTVFLFIMGLCVLSVCGRRRTSMRYLDPDEVLSPRLPPRFLALQVKTTVYCESMSSSSSVSESPVSMVSVDVQYVPAEVIMIAKL